ncbi:MAG: hypothetical protein HY819_18805 [Acidobacteria bacterium]|nr:hypothetical protein [Acidobacteriota bacterium]
MREEIFSWDNLTPTEQKMLTKTLSNLSNETEAINLFNNMTQATRDSLINIYYLSTSDKVAGNIWQYIKSLRWAGQNQIGVYAENPSEIYSLLLKSKNFTQDDWLTCLIKTCYWSLRQTQVNNQNISDYGMQVYYPKDPKQPELLVIDIDTIVFSSWVSWPKHALDILIPDPKLNNPLRARQALAARGIFPK